MAVSLAKDYDVPWVPPERITPPPHKPTDDRLRERIREQLADHGGSQSRTELLRALGTRTTAVMLNDAINGMSEVRTHRHQGPRGAPSVHYELTEAWYHQGLPPSDPDDTVSLVSTERVAREFAAELARAFTAARKYGPDSTAVTAAFQESVRAVLARRLALSVSGDTPDGQLLDTGSLRRAIQRQAAMTGAEAAAEFRGHGALDIRWAIEAAEDAIAAITVTPLAEPAPPPTPEPSPEPEPQHVQIREHAPAPASASDVWQARYRTAILTTDGSIEMFKRAALPELRRLALEVVNREAPVHENEVVERIREAWGLGRCRGASRENVHRAIKLLHQNGSITYADRILDVPRPGPLLARVPSADGYRRPLAHIPPAERQLALVELLRTYPDVPEDELVRDATRFFGFGRMGGTIEKELRRDIAALLAKGAFAGTPGRLELAARSAVGH